MDNVNLCSDENNTTFETLFLEANLKKADFQVSSLTPYDDKLVINVLSNNKSSVCPYCHQITKKKHGSYLRTIQVLPINGKATYMVVKERLFDCLNEDCRQKTFTEDLGLARRKMRFSNALYQTILVIAFFTSSEGASRILKTMGVLISADSIDRMLRRITIEDNSDVTTLGVDDISIRKGVEYLTVIYNGDTKMPIALVDRRDGEELKKFLEGHRKVMYVARDRDTAFAKAITTVLPNCIQSADKFHLFSNLMKAIHDILIKELPNTIHCKNDEIVDIDSPKTVDITTLDYTNDPFMVGKRETDTRIRIKNSKSYQYLKKN
jgi:transposase